MKKNAKRRLAGTILLAIVIFIILNSGYQMRKAQQDMIADSNYIFMQLVMGRAENGRALTEAAGSMDSLYILIDADSMEVLESTERQYEGKQISQIGIPLNTLDDTNGFHLILAGDSYFGLFMLDDGVYYGRLMNTYRLYEAAIMSNVTVLLILIILFCMVHISFWNYMDKNVFGGIHQLRQDIGAIAEGDLDVNVTVGGDEDFLVISESLNDLRKKCIKLQEEIGLQSELIQLERDHAQAAVKAKKIFLSEVSHDIRTPINGIIGMSAIAETYLDDEKQVKAALDKIDESAKYILSMVNDVQNMDLIDSGSLVLNEEEINLSTLLRETEEAMRPAAVLRGHTMMVGVDQLIHENVIGDAVRIKEILNNLITNAVKYTPRGGNINVTIREIFQEDLYTSQYAFVVSDDGIGMSHDLAAHLFEMHGNLWDNEYMTELKGTGLGLAIVQSIVMLMDGTIEVESEPDQGTTFTVMVRLKLPEKVRGTASSWKRNMQEKQEA